MAILVWFMMGIALWHFTVFLPDRFWQGIVGAFLGAITGALISGAIMQVVTDRSIGDTGLITAFWAIPGTALGLLAIYYIGIRAEAAEE